MIVAKNCCFWSVFPQISCGGYPQNLSKFPKPHFLLTCTYFGGRRHGRNLPMAKATDGLAFGVTRHCRIEGLPPIRRPLNFNCWRATHVNQTLKKDKNEFWNCYLAMLGRVAKPIFTMSMSWLVFKAMSLRKRDSEK